jgi:hypothetical protein
MDEEIDGSVGRIDQDALNKAWMGGTEGGSGQSEHARDLTSPRGVGKATWR